MRRIITNNNSLLLEYNGIDSPNIGSGIKTITENNPKTLSNKGI